MLKAAGQAAEEAGVSCALERISGNTVESIVAFADAKDADMIVVGSRGRNPVATRCSAASPRVWSATPAGRSSSSRP